MNMNVFYFSKRNEKLLLLSILVILISLFLPLKIKAQTENEDVGWTFIQESEGVKFYYQKGECDGQNVIFLKVSNSNAVMVTGSWKLNIEASPHKLIFYDVIAPTEAGKELVGTCISPDPGLIIPVDYSSFLIQEVSLTATIEKN